MVDKDEEEIKNIIKEWCRRRSTLTTMDDHWELFQQIDSLQKSELNQVTTTSL